MKLENDPRLPVFGSADYERRLLLRLTELFRRIAQVVNINDGHLDQTTAAPTNPVDGDMRYADGTSWNPGGGEGFYGYYGGTWNKLG